MRIYVFTSLTASRRKLSEQETLASSTSRPNSSNASSIDTSKPGQFFSENTFIRNPFSRVSTFTCWKVQVQKVITLTGQLNFTCSNLLFQINIASRYQIFDRLL